jgi:hypothetical protein
MIAKIQAELNEMLQHYLFERNDANTRMNISHDIQVIIQRNLKSDPPAIKIDSSRDGNSISIWVEDGDELLGLNEYLEKINENFKHRRYPR